MQAQVRATGRFFQLGFTGVDRGQPGLAGQGIGGGLDVGGDVADACQDIGGQAGAGFFVGARRRRKTKGQRIMVCGRQALFARHDAVVVAEDQAVAGDD